MSKIFILIFVVSASLAQAADNHPCEDIVQACQAAKFVNGGCKTGTGLWDNCVNPIMQNQVGQAQAASGMSVPSIPAGVVAACLQKRSSFGKGKIGVCKK